MAPGSAMRMVAGWNLTSRVTRWAAGAFIFVDAAAFRAVGGFSPHLYATEEIDLFRRLKRLARQQRRRVAILSRPSAARRAAARCTSIPRSSWRGAGGAHGAHRRPHPAAGRTTVSSGMTAGVRQLTAAVAVAALLAAGCRREPTPTATAADDQWPAYAGAAGARSSALARSPPPTSGGSRSRGPIAPASSGRTPETAHKLTFEATPIHFDGRLYLATAYGRVVALDPATGAEIWRFDAGVDRTAPLQRGDLARGVGLARLRRPTPDAPCARRIFAGTIDARLLALDAATGRPCAGVRRRRRTCGWPRAPAPKDRPITR